MSSIGLTKLGLFGSVSREENTQSRDIDILFEVDEKTKFSMFKYLKLNKYLEDNFHSHIDLVRESTIKDTVKPLPKDVASKYPDIPWSEIAKMRDVLTHHYFGVNDKIL